MLPKTVTWLPRTKIKMWNYDLIQWSQIVNVNEKFS